MGRLSLSSFWGLVMPWIVLVIAGLLEVVWASAMKQSERFTRLWPGVVTVSAMLISFGLLSWSKRSLPKTLLADRAKLSGLSSPLAAGLHRH